MNSARMLLQRVRSRPSTFVENVPLIVDRTHSDPTLFHPLHVEVCATLKIGARSAKMILIEVSCSNSLRTLSMILHHISFRWRLLKNAFEKMHAANVALTYSVSGIVSSTRTKSTTLIAFPLRRDLRDAQICPTATAYWRITIDCLHFQNVRFACFAKCFRTKFRTLYKLRIQKDSTRAGNGHVHDRP